MGKFLTRNDLTQIVNNRPEGVEPTDILNDLAYRGFEIEGYNAEFSAGDMMHNLFPSAGRFIKDIAYAFRHLVQTVKGLASIGKAFGEKGLSVVGREVSDDSQRILEQLGEFASDRYGTGERIANTIEKDPIGFIADVSALVTGVGGAVKGTGSLLGKISKSSRVADISSAMQKAGGVGIKTGKVLEPSLIVTDAMTPATKSVIRSGAKAFMKTGIGEKIEDYARVTFAKAINLSKSEQNPFTAIYPRKSVVDKAAEFGYNGTLTEMRDQALIHGNTSKTHVDDSLSRITTTHVGDKTVQKVLDVLDTELAAGRIKISKDKFVTSEKAMALEQKWHDMSIKNSTEGLTVSEMNELGRDYNSIIDAYQNKAEIGGIGTVTVEANVPKKRTMGEIRDELRDSIDDKAKAGGYNDYRSQNKETMFATRYANMMQEMMNVFADKSDFTDSLVLMGGIMGSVLSMSARILATAASVTGLRVYIKSPKFASAFLNDVLTLRGTEFADMASALQAGKHVGTSSSTTRKIFKKLQPVFPEIRIASKASQPEQATQFQEENQQ